MDDSKNTFDDVSPFLEIDFEFICEVIVCLFWFEDFLNGFINRFEKLRLA